MILFIMATSPPKDFHGAPGPFRASDIVAGEPYELSNGHRIECMPTGGRGAGPNAHGAAVLGSDPNVREIGVDPGYSPNPRTLRAPDIGVGNVPDAPGWIEGAPPLAVEYSDIGQDESALQSKIQDLLSAGTQYIWVVRLTGPRRIEVYERSKAMYTVYPGQNLHAPGVLKNPVLVEALYDRDAAHEATLRNLLQSKGYEDLEAVRREGQKQALCKAILDLAGLMGVELGPDQMKSLARMEPSELQATMRYLVSKRAWPA